MEKLARQIASLVCKCQVDGGRVDALRDAMEFHFRAALLADSCLLLCTLPIFSNGPLAPRTHACALPTICPRTTLPLPRLAAALHAVRVSSFEQCVRLFWFDGDQAEDVRQQRCSAPGATLQTKSPRHVTLPNPSTIMGLASHSLQLSATCGSHSYRWIQPGRGWQTHPRLPAPIAQLLLLVLYLRICACGSHGVQSHSERNDEICIGRRTLGEDGGARLPDRRIPHRASMHSSRHCAWLHRSVWACEKARRAAHRHRPGRIL